MSISSTINQITRNARAAVGQMGGGSDSRFFQNTSKKGETHELREELQSQNKDKKRDAVKKVIANMTIGKDVSMLFTDVVNCIQTANVELKKLVYLYIINYAKSNPDLALLAVNTFCKDANDANPLIRALAVRTMGCIRVDRIVEYLCEPLARALRDDDPYVRKTAAICVAKLYDISAEMVEDRGFLDILRDLICDSNPTVVANAVAALSEIQETSGKDVTLITGSVLQKLLAALNECTEWGQVYILDALSKYTPGDQVEAEGIIERVTPRLQHANSAVVMSAAKVILGYLDMCNPDVVRTMNRKLAPPLVTLLNSEPEIQYVALRNINLIVQKRPAILEHEIKVFFCKYNDPIYVKMEKLEIIIRLASDRNVEQVLLELKEYAQEVDVDFVRRAVRAIGRAAIKLERAAERCINVLLELIQTKVNYVVQEAIIVIKDIFRRYPNRYEQVIAALCESLETLDEPEAKASMIWIIGEYADRIENADELLDSFFLDSFSDETPQVQLQLLTATVKIFLKSPAETQALVQRVLNLATEGTDNPDLRDRGFIYWRLLSHNPQVARAVVLGEKPTIADDTFALEPALLDSLIHQIATLSSIYHKPPEAFVVRAKVPVGQVTGGGGVAEYDEDLEYLEGEIGSIGNARAVQGQQGREGGGEVDLLDLGAGGDGSVAPAAAGAGGGGGLDDFLGGGGSAAPAATVKSVVCTPEQGGGLGIRAALRQDGNGSVVCEMDFSNQAPAPLQALAIKFNVNTFGLMPASPQIIFSAPVPQGGSASHVLPLTLSPAMVAQGAAPTLQLQTAVKNMTTGNVFYFAIPLDMTTLFAATGQTDRASFIPAWKSIDDSSEVSATVSSLPPSSCTSDGVIQKLAAHRVVFVARRPVPGAAGQESLYFSAVMMTNPPVHVLLEITLQAGVPQAKLAVRTQTPALAPLTLAAVEGVLRN
ncbi:beta-adaptin-like protein c [Nannochloropsis oceanica]